MPPSAYSWTMAGYTQDKDAYLKRLRRIEGQVRGLQRMVENDTYCIDILTQVSAVTRALQAVALGLVEDHLGHCVAQAIEEGGPDEGAAFGLEAFQTMLQLCALSCGLGRLRRRGCRILHLIGDLEIDPTLLERPRVAALASARNATASPTARI